MYWESFNSWFSSGKSFTAISASNSFWLSKIIKRYHSCWTNRSMYSVRLVLARLNISERVWISLHLLTRPCLLASIKLGGIQRLQSFQTYQYSCKIVCIAFMSMFKDVSILQHVTCRPCWSVHEIRPWK